jgi:hypothetical protein
MGIEQRYLCAPHVTEALVDGAVVGSKRELRREVGVGVRVKVRVRLRVRVSIRVKKRFRVRVKG